MWKGKTLLTAKEISKLLGVKLQKQRKLYPVEHKEIHHIGWKPDGIRRNYQEETGIQCRNKQQSNKPA